ncbi:hypothetical protein A3Q29_04660 [Providencia stuartii]|uniref:Uncharacterized protein n=1 Tax=Providencia stuartii TaxID=588 RepID=A0A1S1HRD2_PROST|nr:hypothetical protein A3Q29_04660 [Providencia stuartii]
MAAVVRGSEINEENQFIDFRLITRSGKNHAFIPLRQQPQSGSVEPDTNMIIGPTKQQSRKGQC